MPEQQIVHLYRLEDGTITETVPPWGGTSRDIVVTLDCPSADTRDALMLSATKKLKEYSAAGSVSVGSAEADLRLGDIVSARDRLTGMVAVATVKGKILKLDDRGETIETRVG